MATLSETGIRHLIHPLWAWREHPGLYSFFREYEETQFWSLEKIRELQWQRFRKIVQFAFDRCPYYADRYRQAGVCPDNLRSSEDLIRLPVLTKDDIRSNQDGLTARGLPPHTYEDNYTGGSTGSPIAFKVEKSRWASRKAMTMRHDYWCEWRIGTKMGLLWGHPDEQADQTLWGGCGMLFSTANWC